MKTPSLLPRILLLLTCCSLSYGDWSKTTNKYCREASKQSSIPWFNRQADCYGSGYRYCTWNCARSSSKKWGATNSCTPQTSSCGSHIRSQDGVWSKTANRYCEEASKQSLITWFNRREDCYGSGYRYCTWNCARNGSKWGATNFCTKKSSSCGSDIYQRGNQGDVVWLAFDEFQNKYCEEASKQSSISWFNSREDCYGSGYRYCTWNCARSSRKWGGTDFCTPKSSSCGSDIYQRDGGFDLLNISAECYGDDEKIVYWEHAGGNNAIKSIDNCADYCKSKSSLFAYGKNWGGSNRRCGHANGGAGCQCICETTAKSDGTCRKARHYGYNLYIYACPAKTYSGEGFNKTCGRTRNGRCTVPCKSGYTGQAASIKCDKGKWSGSGPTCIKRLDCSKVTMIELKEVRNSMTPARPTGAKMEASGEVDNCEGQDELTKTQKLSTATTVMETQEYRLDKSIKQSFSVEVTPSIEIEMSAGFNAGLFGPSVDLTAGFGLSVGVGLGFDQTVGAGKTLISSKSQRLSYDAQSSVAVKPGRKTLLTQTLDQYEYETRFEATAQCADKNGKKLEERTVVGTFKGSTFKAASGVKNTAVNCPHSACQDKDPSWHDIDGTKFDCQWYDLEDNCKLYGDKSRNMGLTANENCCVCGGGNRKKGGKKPPKK